MYFYKRVSVKYHMEHLRLNLLYVYIYNVFLELLCY